MFCKNKVYMLSMNSAGAAHIYLFHRETNFILLQTHFPLDQFYLFSNSSSNYEFVSVEPSSAQGATTSLTLICGQNLKQFNHDSNHGLIIVRYDSAHPEIILEEIKTKYAPANVHCWPRALWWPVNIKVIWVHHGCDSGCLGIILINTQHRILFQMIRTDVLLEKGFVDSPNSSALRIFQIYHVHNSLALTFK